MGTEKFTTGRWTLTGIYDTRHVDMMTGKRLPETGEYVSCECCGREIVVHAHVCNRETGERCIIGTECCKSLGLRNGIYAAGNRNYWRIPNKVFGGKLCVAR